MPGKKALLEDNEIEIVVVDVTESSIERPQKNNVHATQEKKAAHDKNSEIPKKKPRGDKLSTEEN